MPARRPPEDCSGFPTRDVSNQRIWRVTGEQYRHRPWWYASLPLDGDDDGGRFDLPQPRGTSYWATERLAAAAEVLLRDAETGTLPVSMLLERVVVETEAPAAALADLTHSEAAAYGVTNEISAAPRPYDVPQEWARALDQVSDGIYYLSSQHTSGRSCAFFGEGGQGDEAPDECMPLASIREDIEEGLRLRFLDMPALTDVDPVPEPSDQPES